MYYKIDKDEWFEFAVAHGYETYCDVVANNKYFLDWLEKPEQLIDPNSTLAKLDNMMVNYHFRIGGGQMSRWQDYEDWLNHTWFLLGSSYPAISNWVKKYLATIEIAKKNNRIEHCQEIRYSDDLLYLFNENAEELGRFIQDCNGCDTKTIAYKYRKLGKKVRHQEDERIKRKLWTELKNIGLIKCQYSNFADYDY